MAVGCVLLDIQLGIHRHVRLEGCLAVFIAVNNLQKAVRRDNAAIRSRQILSGIQPPGNVPDFAIHAKLELLILLQNFLQVNFYPLPLVGDMRLGSGDLHILSRIAQCNGNRIGIERHAMRSLPLKNLIGG